MLKIPMLPTVLAASGIAWVAAALLAPAAAGAAEEAAPKASPGAAPLELVVHGTRSGGIVNWALYGDEAQHDASRQMRGGRQDAEGSTTTVSVGAVEPGRYSMAVFLDLDGDGEFDQSFLGIPQEPFGFSNDVLGPLGKPSFEQASFEVGAGGARIELTLKEL